MAEKNILIADDESRMRRMIADFLKKAGFNVLEAENGRQAIDLFFSNKSIDLVVLDIMMPEYDGWAVCREIRKQSQVPIIMLTARTEESDQLFGFELGVDEYVTKPFSPSILVAKITAILRRYGKALDNSYSFDGLLIDTAKRVVLVDNVTIDLSPKEYELLLYLASNVGIALSREQILNGVWGYDFYGDTRTVDTHIKRLRSKLGSKDELLQTVRGCGYRFEVPS